MRLLFTFVGGRGHFEPLLPIARAAEAKGHVVVFGCAPSMVELVEAASLSAMPIGAFSAGSPERAPLLPVDRDREARDLRERFVRRAAVYRAPHALALCTEWQPDVVVCDETDFGAMVAAECAGLPYASVLVTAAGSFVRQEVIGEAVAELRAAHGLPPDPSLAMLARHLVISPFPPSFRDPAHPLPETAHSFRPALVDRADATARQQSWASVRAGAPTVYFTLGTIFNMESGDLLQRVVAGLRELPINLVVTVGHDIDPAELGAQPAHVHIAQYIPQSAVLPHCDLVVSHAGSGSVIGALAHGLPSVLIPIGADQPQNADRCESLGVGRVLDASSVTPETARAAVAAALGDHSLQRNAEALRDEIAALPDMAEAVPLLELLFETTPSTR